MTLGFPSDAPVVATFRSPVFNLSETFVRGRVEGLTRYQPLICGRNFVGNVPEGFADRIILPKGLAGRLRLDTLGPGPAYLRRMASYHPVLIHAHFATDGMAAMMAARRLGLPFVTTLCGYDVTRGKLSLMLSGSLSKMRYVLFGAALKRECALFLPVCDYLRDVAIAQGYPEERTITHYIGVDLDSFHPGDEPREPGTILFVGRLAEKKGVGLLLEALAWLRGEGLAARLVAIGDGPLRRDLERRTAELGLEGAVDWLGARPKAEVAGWMRRVSVAAVPSLTGADGNAEGLPNVVVEASASGLPVVASRHAGIPEAVIHEENGLLVPEGEVAPLAAALKACLGSQALRARFGAQGRRLAETRFDYRRKMEDLQDLYDRVIAQHRA